MLLWLLSASAGTLTLDDRAGILDPVEAVRLEQEARPLPFDVVVLTTSDDPAGPRRIAEGLRTKPREVVVAVDPVHRLTWAEIGPGVGLEKAEFAEVANAGAGAFKQKRWADGLMAMMLRAATPSPRAAPAPTVVATPPALPAAEDPSFPILAVLGAVLALGTLVAIFVLVREDRRLASRERTLPGDGDTPSAPDEPGERPG